MVKKEFKIIFLFSCLLTVILISGCANQLPPGGGEIDLIPPKIVEAYPQNGTTNFTDDYFELSFSEYVDKRSLTDAIFISPAFEGAIEFDWSGTDVKIYFPEKLKDSITYVINIGTDVVDFNNRNRMDSTFTVIFSTGNKIDKGKIEGKIFQNLSEGVMIFGYKISSDSDTLLLRKSDYISQTGKDGFYSLAGLSNGVYRVFAVQDEFKDFIFQSDQDKIGIPFKDVVISDQDTLVDNLNFFLADYDTIPPRIFSATFTDRHHIIAKFSEPVDSTLIKTSNFMIIDSTSLFSEKPLFTFRGNTKSDEITIVTKDTFSIANNIYLFADSIRDKSGNTYLSDYTGLTVSDKADTNKPSIFKSIPDKNSPKVDYMIRDYYLFLDDAFDKNLITDAITFLDTSGKSILFKTSFVDDATLKISLDKNLNPKNRYFLKTDLSKFRDVEGNKIDSVITYSFSTISGLDFTGVSGKLIGTDSSSNPILVLQEENNKQLIYFTKPDKEMNFDFKRIEPGTYQLWCFLDINNDGKYSFGLPDPIKHSEKFSFYNTKLILKARWSLTDINFIFK